MLVAQLAQPLAAIGGSSGKRAAPHNLDARRRATAKRKRATARILQVPIAHHRATAKTQARDGAHFASADCAKRAAKREWRDVKRSN